ncbi:DinB family protein [soil metagenome]
MTTQQTINETRQVFADIQAFIAKHGDIEMLQAPSGKWNSAQQVDHLAVSQKMTNVAYKVPGLVLGLVYGKSKNGSRSYEEIVAEYQRHLSNGAKCVKEYLPKLALPLDKQKLATTYISYGDDYLATIETKSEKDFDTLRVKHPILGKLTLRELAHFTLYHNRHHLKSMQGLVQ